MRIAQRGTDRWDGERQRNWTSLGKASVSRVYENEPDGQKADFGALYDTMTLAGS